MKKIQLVLAAALLALLAAGRPASAAKVGSDAPNFSVAGSDGKTYSLKELKGSYVVLEWTNHDCPFVHKHYDGGNMQGLQKEFTEKGVKWFSIVSSKPGSEGAVTPKQANEIMAELDRLAPSGFQEAARQRNKRRDE